MLFCLAASSHWLPIKWHRVRLPLKVLPLPPHHKTPAPVPGGAPNAGATPERPNQPNFIGFERTPPPMNIPVGFTPLFNGMNLQGWHVSPTNHHGHTPDFHVAHGMIIGSQQPLGGGGILISDRKFKNFELYMEVKPDYGCDSGIFLRTTEWGAAYQVTMDYLPGGGMGNVIGEGGITGVGGRGRGGRAGAPGAAEPPDGPVLRARRAEHRPPVRASAPAVRPQLRSSEASRSGAPRRTARPHG